MKPGTLIQNSVRVSVQRPRVLIAALFVLVPLLTGASEDHVRVVLVSPSPSPFTTIRYEIVKRGTAVSASHRRHLPGHGESLHGAGLLTRAEQAEVWDLVNETGATQLSDAKVADPRHGELTWEVHVSLGGKHNSFKVTDPINQPDRRYFRLIDAVKRVVKKHAGDLPFRNIFYSPRSLGWINIVSVPQAHVIIDGFDTKLVSPLFGYELNAGVHAIQLKSLDGIYDRTYKVRIEPSGTTRLGVDLR